MILQELFNHLVVAGRECQKPPFLRTVRDEECSHISLSDAVLLSETSVVLSTLLRSNLRDVRGLRRRDNHH